MPGRILRRDYAFGKKCYFCHRPFATGIALIAFLPSIGEVAIGPVCAGKEEHALDRPPGALPDLSGGLSWPSKDISSTVRNSSRPPSPLTAGQPIDAAGVTDDQVVIEYAILRANLLPALGFEGLSHPLLTALARQYDGGCVQATILNRARGLRSACNERVPSLRHTVMSACYTAAYWIDRCLECSALTNTDASRLRSLREYLLRYRRLTVRQIDLINRELGRLVDGRPHIDRVPFDGTLTR